MKKRVVGSWVAFWAAAIGCSGSASAPTTSSCAALTTCCVQASPAEKSVCAAVAGDGVESVCASELMTYQSTGVCSAASTTGCAALSQCCSAMPTGPTQVACTQVVAAANATTCSAELTAYQASGQCGSTSGSSSSSTAGSSTTSGSGASTGTGSGSNSTSASGVTTSQSSGSSTAIVDDAGFQDARPPIDAPVCVPDAGPAGPGPLTHTCIIYPAGADDNNECDGHHDPPSPFPANGVGGNGFDDNCNGLVDEGCACDAVGTTKACYLVPATQTENGVPVGWCATNSKGTVDCAQQQGTRSSSWSGVCRGAQPPYANDVCSPGDFNCDGKAENPTGESCECQSSAVTCPTAALTTVPYPPASSLPLAVEAGTWFSNPAAVSQATNWKWTVTGGDCDNILPNPTFALYGTPNGTGAPAGTTSTTLGPSGNEHGTVATTLGAVAYPAFSLSGDYLLSASWDLAGKAYSCSLQIHVRAPGLRAEGCWDTEREGDDLDIHMAKINGFAATCPATQAWSDLACMTANEDCFYGDCYGDALGNADTVDWGFAASPASACTGWGSQSSGTSCGNPRLDRDANGLSGICDPTVVNPNGSSATGPFCGPENINLDAPANGDQYALGMRFYTKNGATNPRMHVAVYCDGERVLSAGYDPLTGNNFPQVATAGADSMGDMWKVGIVTTTVTGGALSCAVSPTASQVADVALDGTTAFCVDDVTLNGANSQTYLTTGGGTPANAAALCFH